MRAARKKRREREREFFEFKFKILSLSENTIFLESASGASFFGASLKTQTLEEEEEETEREIFFFFFFFFFFFTFFARRGCLKTLRVRNVRPLSSELFLFF